MSKFVSVTNFIQKTLREVLESCLSAFMMRRCGVQAARAHDALKVLSIPTRRRAILLGHPTHRLFTSVFIVYVCRVMAVCSESPFTWVNAHNDYSSTSGSSLKRAAEPSPESRSDCWSIQRTCGQKPIEGIHCSAMADTMHVIGTRLNGGLHKRLRFE